MSWPGNSAGRCPNRGVNILAFEAFPTDGKALFRFVVNNPATAKTALVSERISCTELGGLHAVTANPHVISARISGAALMPPFTVVLLLCCHCCFGNPHVHGESATKEFGNFRRANCFFCAPMLSGLFAQDGSQSHMSRKHARLEGYITVTVCLKTSGVYRSSKMSVG